MELTRRTGLARGLALAAPALCVPALTAKAQSMDSVVNRYATIRDFRLRNGTVMPDVTLAYETYGALNAAGDNAILMTHGFTGSHHAAGRYAPGQAPPGLAEDAAPSWSLMIGPGRPIDPARHFIVSSNMLGSSYGSTSPRSTNPATGRPYGPDFPHITVADIVTAQRLLLEQLGIRHLIAVMGTSYGGYQAWSWGTLFPQAMNAIIAVNTAPKATAGPAGTAAQIARLAQDPNWNGGWYYDTPGGISQVMTEIRVATLKNYGIEAQLEGRFPPGEAREAEIRRLAAPWVRAFDGNSMVVLRRATESYDAEANFGALKAKVLYALTTTDKLFPPSIAPAVMQKLTAAKKDARFFEIRNQFGHIGANTESPDWVPTLAAFITSAGG